MLIIHVDCLIRHETQVRLAIKTTNTTTKDSLAKLVCDVDEISLLPIIYHHAQTIRVTVGSWFERKKFRTND